MKQATADDKGKYSIHDIAGVDKAHIWVELLQWSGSGAIDYDGSEGAADITVLEQMLQQEGLGDTPFQSPGS